MKTLVTLIFFLFVLPFSMSKSYSKVSPDSHKINLGNVSLQTHDLGVKIAGGRMHIIIGGDAFKEEGHDQFFKHVSSPLINTKLAQLLLISTFKLRFYLLISLSSVIWVPI